MNAFEQVICEETRTPHDSGHRVFIRCHYQGDFSDPSALTGELISYS